jgi:hypothetical protein
MMPTGLRDDLYKTNVGMTTSGQHAVMMENRMRVRRRHFYEIKRRERSG